MVHSGEMSSVPAPLDLLRVIVFIIYHLYAAHPYANCTAPSDALDD